jgi:hypothetical protein
MIRSRMRAGIFLLMAPALLSACNGSGAGTGGYPAAPGAVLLHQLPAELPQHQATARELAADDVASATPADPAKVKGFLSGSSFGAGYIRIWTQDPDYVTLMALAFSRPADAQRMVQLEVAELKTSVNTYVTEHKELPGSYVFVISSQTRSGGKTVICEGVWLPSGNYAIETLTCSERGAWATWAERLAQQESDLVKQVAG